MISYLSKPLQSTIKPFRDNAELIAKVSEQKQNKYENVLDYIFKQENQLINLDTLNKEATEIKNKYLKQIEGDLNAASKLDFLIPENIRRIDNIFTPMLEDAKLMEDVYETKEIRKNLKFANEILEKTPTVGNKLNLQAAMVGVEAYRNAPIDELSKYAQNATLFAPFIDIKDKWAKFQKDYIPGVKYDIETIINGEDWVQTVEGIKTPGMILEKFYSSLTPEDFHQLKLDGINTYHRDDISGLMGELKKRSTTDRPLYEKKIEKVNESMKGLFDSNMDGVLDKEYQSAPLAGDWQRQLDDLRAVRGFYETKIKSLDRYNNYITEFETNKDLAFGDKLNLYQMISSDDMSNDIVTLFSSEGTSFKYKYSNKDLFDWNMKFKEEEKKEAAKKKDKDEPKTRWIDIDRNSIPGSEDIFLTDGIGYTEVPGGIFETIDESGLKVYGDVKINFADGTSVETNLSSYKIPKFDNVLNEKISEISQEKMTNIDEQLRNISWDGNKGFSQEKYDDNLAKYKQFQVEMKKIELEKDEAVKAKKLKDVEESFGQDLTEEFKSIYSYQNSLSNLGNILDLTSKIDNYLLGKKGYADLIKNASKVTTYTYGELISKFDFIRDYGGEGLTKEAKDKYSLIYDNIKNVKLNVGDSEKDIVQKAIDLNNLLTNEQKEFLKTPLVAGSPLSRVINSGQISTRLQNPFESAMISFYNAKNDIVEQLLTLDAPLMINFFDQQNMDKIKKADVFFNTASGYFNSNWSATGKKLVEQKWEPLTPEDIKEFKSGNITLNTYNTSNGELIGNVPGIGAVKVDIPPQVQGLPYGVPVNDVASKLLMFNAIESENGVSNGLKAGEFGGRPLYIIARSKVSSGQPPFAVVAGNNLGNVVFQGYSVTELENKVLMALKNTNAVSTYVNDAELFRTFTESLTNIIPSSQRPYQSDSQTSNEQ